MVARDPTSRSWNYLSYLRTARGFVKITAGACDRWNSVEPSSRGRERERGEKRRGKKRGRSAFSTPEVLLKRANSIVNGHPPPRGATRQQRRWKRFFIKIRIQRDTRRILNSRGSIVRAEREVLLDIRILIWTLRRKVWTTFFLLLFFLSSIETLITRSSCIIYQLAMKDWRNFPSE